ncbi:SDR family NAD(P)-dependent oxidoreductase [Saccharopolyspora sp. HNM0983]|uniref:SDR family NAD(P)-dependent oxidoreductase n=1 Tax=Saccharopolyspora montiporae TaxID=2781240 RepID=A0A929FYR2_9PSEU|nr:oxidoreductase [Saccharopolyspora sp. HNM0983]MBE9372967.1 SDR family NAD(P)-dependent oxidoreductase [Saccharopolyspora sp. HNM0983]
MLQNRWTADELTGYAGRTAVITGATSGVGLATAQRLARAGAHVVLAVRDRERGARAASRVGGSTEVRELDLGDLSSVRAFAAGFGGEIDVLVNNAGVAMVDRGRTADGFETQFGVNHLGHFALTNLLLPQITRRVVTVASGAHRAGRIHFGDLDLERSGYGRVKGYAQSKLANLLFVLELQRRFTRTGSAVRALAAHPGYAATNLGTPGRGQLLTSLTHAAGRAFAQPPRKAALPTLFALDQDIPGGSYVGPDGRHEMHGYPTLVGRSAAASDPHSARRLWEVSAELTGTDFAAD